MAITEVGGGSQRAVTRNAVVTNINIAFPTNVTSGSLLIAAGRAIWSSGSGVTVTDTRGTSYTAFIGSDQGDGGRPWIAYGIAPGSGANTVNVAAGGGGTFTLVSGAIDEFDLDGLAIVVVDGGSSTGNSSSPSDSIALTTTQSLVIGALAWQFGSRTATEGSGYTLIDMDGTYAVAVEFQVFSSAGTKAVDYSITGGSTPWSAMSVGFQEDAAGVVDESHPFVGFFV